MFFGDFQGAATVLPRPPKAGVNYVGFGSSSGARVSTGESLPPETSPVVMLDHVNCTISVQYGPAATISIASTSMLGA